MWELYDALINEIPENITVQDYCNGRLWSEVQTNQGTGVAMLIDEVSRAPMHPTSFFGEPLKKMAECIKSWNFAEASLGLAVINAWYNTPPHTDSLNITYGKNRVERDAFVTYQEEITDKKVTVIGHFPFLETRFQPICSLSVLERNPKEGDFPDSACEYLLHEQDYVFITGVTIINKTLPRLLKLSKNAKVVLVGPSVPLAPCLFHFGVHSLESFLVTSPQKCSEFVRQGLNGSLFSCGKMVSLANKTNTNEVSL